MTVSAGKCILPAVRRWLERMRLSHRPTRTEGRGEGLFLTYKDGEWERQFPNDDQTGFANRKGLLRSRGTLLTFLTAMIKYLKRKVML